MCRLARRLSHSSGAVPASWCVLRPSGILFHPRIEWHCCLSCLQANSLVLQLLPLQGGIPPNYLHQLTDQLRNKQISINCALLVASPSVANAAQVGTPYAAEIEPLGGGKYGFKPVSTDHPLYIQ